MVWSETETETKTKFKNQNSLAPKAVNLSDGTLKHAAGYGGTPVITTNCFCSLPHSVYSLPHTASVLTGYVGTVELKQGGRELSNFLGDIVLTGDSFIILVQMFWYEWNTLCTLYNAFHAMILTRMLHRVISWAQAGDVVLSLYLNKQ